MRKLLAVFLFFILTLPGVLARTPSTYIVSTAGNDMTGVGSLGNPWRTPDYCKQQMQPGDTCYIKRGTYNGGMEFGYDIGYGGSTSGTSFGNPNTLAAFPGDEGLVIFTNATYDQILNFSGQPGVDHYPQYWIIRDIVFDGSNGDGSHCEAARTCTGEINGGGDHIKFINIEVKDTSENGIIFDGDDWEFINVNIHGTGDVLPTDTSHGIYWHGNNSIMIGGSSHDNTGYGIQMYNGGTLVSHNVVIGARLYNNYTGHLRPIQHGGGGIVMGSGSDNHTINSLIYNNFGNGVDIDYRCGLYSDGSVPDFLNPCTARNNTIYGNEQSAVALGYNNGVSAANCMAFFSRPCTNAILENNIFYNNGTDNYSMDAGNATVVEHTDLKGVNPSFVSAGTGDFRIPLGSAAAGYGTNLTSTCSGILVGLCATFNGLARPSVGAWDAGAYNAGDVAGTPASIASISPNSGIQGTSVAINVVGSSTSFVNSTTVCSLSGTGITINSTVISDSTHGVCNITISGGATVGLRNLTMTTGGEVATGTNVFTVNMSISILSILPFEGVVGNSVVISVLGSGTHFSNGSSVCSISDPSNIIVNGTTSSDATHAVCTITIASNAVPSVRSLTITTGGEVVTAVNSFSVLSTAARDRVRLKR